MPSLRGSDWPDPAQIAGHGGDPGQYLPRQRHIQQPGRGPAITTHALIRLTARAGNSGRNRRGQLRPVLGGAAHLPAVIVIAVAGVTGRAIVRARTVVVQRSVLITRRRHVIHRPVKWVMVQPVAWVMVRAAGMRITMRVTEARANRR
jgi:hypothetical protein